MPAAAVEEEGLPLEIEAEDMSKGAPMLGVVHSFLSATQAQENILELSEAADRYILALLFTFDREDVMTAWTNAIKVEVGIAASPEPFASHC